MPGKVPDWIWLPLGIVVGVAASRLALAPRVVDRKPAPGAIVPATTEIRISFTQAMDEASVAERLCVDSQVPGQIGWEGATLIYHPEGGWPSRSTVEVALRAGARSRRGLSMIAGMETHLFAWEVADGTLSDLTAVGGWQAEDISPAFSPEGNWVCFSRRLLGRGGWTSGEQLGRMRANGSRAEPLTDGPFINHGAPAVGPRGNVLAYLRYDLEALTEPAQIRSIDLETRAEQVVAEGGYLPAWIP